MLPKMEVLFRFNDSVNNSLVKIKYIRNILCQLFLILFIDHLHVPSIFFSILTPYPGVDIAQTLKTIFWLVAGLNHE
jgi:hypothetical protein